MSNHQKQNANTQSDEPKDLADIVRSMPNIDSDVRSAAGSSLFIAHMQSMVAVLKQYDALLEETKEILERAYALEKQTENDIQAEEVRKSIL